jgi:hypothetical protein
MRRRSFESDLPPVAGLARCAAEKAASTERHFHHPNTLEGWGSFNFHGEENNPSRVTGLPAHRHAWAKAQPAKSYRQRRISVIFLRKE